jgi:hypothetical protein
MISENGTCHYIFAVTRPYIHVLCGNIFLWKSFVAVCIVYLQFKHMTKNRGKVAWTRSLHYAVHGSKTGTNVNVNPLFTDFPIDDDFSKICKFLSIWPLVRFKYIICFIDVSSINRPYIKYNLLNL